MHIGHRHDIRGDSRVVGLSETGKRERARDEETRGRI
jgi:hypothetical protein